MDPSCSHTLQTDDEPRVLSALLDAFFPVFTLPEIASAYSEAGTDLYKASEILCQLQKGLENDNGVNSTQSEESLPEDIVKDSTQFCNIKESKPKKLNAALGTVSTILGSTYARDTKSRKEIVEPTKPDQYEVPESVQEFVTGAVEVEHLDHRDAEEFLYSILWDSFKLSMDVIRDVLGNCGYDVKKAVDKLLVLSANTLDKGKIDNEIAEKYTIKLSNSDPGSRETHKKCPDIERKSTGGTRPDKEKSDLSRELLVSLFTPPVLFEEEPKKKLEWGLNRTRVVGQSVVTKPLDDFIYVPPSTVVDIPIDTEVGDENDSYRVLRRDAKEHWNKMKERYQAAVEAFSSGDRSKADSLLEEGRYHNQMAREADERSAKEILKTNKSDARNDDVPLDLHAHSTRDSIRLLKKHIVSLANIPMFRYLKVIVNTDADDATKGKRKRMVIKLLERETIKWTEEHGNPGTLFIHLNEIDPSKLTFASNLEGTQST